MKQNTDHSSGLLVAIEGIDGAGKSTLARGLEVALREHDVPTLLTKEPGGTPLGQQLRTILQTQQEPLDPKTEFLLFAADRAQHFSSVITPALEKGVVVLSDRMADSSLVYQGYGRGLDLTTLNAVNSWAMINKKPDVVLYLRVPPDVARQRLLDRGTAPTAFEREGGAFIERLVTGFDELLIDRTSTIVLDGTADSVTIIKQACSALLPLIKKDQ